MLNCNVFKMVVSSICGRFDLDQTPAFVSAAMENIDPHKNVLVFERTLEYHRNFWIGD